MTRPSWNHGGKTRQQRGYGKAHNHVREHLKRTVITCEHCMRQGIIREGCIADHIIPLAKGGTGDRANYQWLCRDHAAAKDALDRGVKRKVRFAADGWPDE